MSAPDRGAWHFFVDYEVHRYGLDLAWGALLKRCHAPTLQALDLDAVLDEITREAAARHGAEPQEIRIRLLSRL